MTASWRPNFVCEFIIVPQNLVNRNRFYLQLNARASFSVAHRLTYPENLSLSLIRPTQSILIDFCEIVFTSLFFLIIWHLS